VSPTALYLASRRSDHTAGIRTHRRVGRHGPGLGQAHRVTNDVDTVSDDQVGLIDVLVAEGSTVMATSIMIETDLKLDVIDVK